MAEAAVAGQVAVLDTGAAIAKTLAVASDLDWIGPEERTAAENLAVVADDCLAAPSLVAAVVVEMAAVAGQVADHCYLDT